MFEAYRPLTLPALLIAAVLALPSVLNAQTSVEGAWIISAWEIDGQTYDQPQRGLFIFTSTHYSVFFVSQAEARAMPTGDEMTDAEKVTAYDEFTANSGRYTLDGNTLTTRAYLAKNPGYMAGFPDNEAQMTVSRDGDTLTLTYGNGNSVTLQRVEGRTPPS